MPEYVGESTEARNNNLDQRYKDEFPRSEKRFSWWSRRADMFDHRQSKPVISEVDVKDLKENVDMTDQLPRLDTEQHTERAWRRHRKEAWNNKRFVPESAKDDNENKTDKVCDHSNEPDIPERFSHCRKPHFPGPVDRCPFGYWHSDVLKNGFQKPSLQERLYREFDFD